MDSTVGRVASGTLGERVRRRRLALGLTRDELATRAGLDVSYLERIERTPTAPTAGELIRLGGALEITLSDLFREQSEGPMGRLGAAAHPVLEAMRQQECMALLAPGGIGRIAFAPAGQQVILPVNFCLQDGLIIFRTAEDSAVAQCTFDPVAFEADRIDDGLREGWSVLVNGRARPATEDEAAHAHNHVEPWAGGDRPVYVAIEPEQVSGRRIRAS